MKNWMALPGLLVVSRNGFRYSVGLASEIRKR